MRCVLLAFLAAFTFAAHASCLPAPDGALVTPASAATPMIVETNATGVAVAWYCSDGFVWTRTMYALRWDAATPALLQAVTSVMQAGDKATAISNVAGVYATTPITDASLIAVYEPAAVRIDQARPSAIVYLVGTNGAAATRAAYNIVGSALVIDVKKRAPIGETCDCTVRLVQAGNAYCRVPSITPEVAYCTKAKK